LATLQLNRFKELCGDVMSEIERRYPNVKASGVNFASLDNLVADLGAMVQDSTVFGNGEKKSMERDIYSKPADSNIFGKPESIRSDNSLKRDLSPGQNNQERPVVVDQELKQLREQVQNLNSRLREKEEEAIQLFQTQQKVLAIHPAKVGIRIQL
jgi:hypothetical protein